jgi:hypothetical protein
MRIMVLKKRDLILILFFLLVGIFLIFLFNYPQQTGIAIVEQNGAEICRFDLQKQNRTEEINVGDKYNVRLKIEPGAISFIHSDCPDQICVKTGKISKPGQAAVCLPAKISVKITGNKKTHDGYTG